MLGGALPGMPPDRGMELELETGDAPMPRSRPVKSLSNGELAELRAQLDNLDATAATDPMLLCCELREHRHGSESRLDAACAPDGSARP